MDRDLRETQLYKDVEDFFRLALGPGIGRASDVSDPQPSPDGRWIAFRGERWERLDGHPVGRIGLAATDGSSVREITSGPNDDDQPRWSPDGRTLTFRSDRSAEGRHQLYALDLDAIGEARPLPAVDGVAELHAWSPGGRQLLVVVAGLEAEQSDAVGSGIIGQAEGLPPWIPEVESFEGVDRTRRRLMLLEIASGEIRPACRGDLNVWEAAWCGDDRIVAIASEEPGESAWYHSRVVLIDPSGETDITLFETDFQLGWVTGSPDGDVVAVVEAICSDRLVVAGDLLLIDPGSGEVRRLDTMGVDVASLAWRADGALTAAGVRGLDTVVLDVDVTTGVAKERWSTDEAGGRFFLAAAPVGDDVTMALNSATRPAELVVISDHGPRTVVSTANEGTDLVRSSVASRRVLSWNAPDGLEIQGLLTLPHGDGPFALILNVHGGPVWAFADTWPGAFEGLLLSRGYALLQPNPRGSWGRGRDFASRVVGDMGGADAHDLLAGVDHVLEMGMGDPERVGVLGGSYGGFMAALLPCLDRRFAAAVSYAPVTDWYSERFDSNLGAWAQEFLGGDPIARQEHYRDRSPVFLVARNQTPTLLTAGLRDRATPIGQATEFYRALRERGVPAELALYPLEGHGVRTMPGIFDVAARTIAWFERFMPSDTRVGTLAP
jgi:dipeptidyl aminopeptidase/acylaminoacyl peptidase